MSGRVRGSKGQRVIVVRVEGETSRSKQQPEGGRGCSAERDEGRISEVGEVDPLASLPGPAANLETLRRREILPGASVGGWRDPLLNQSDAAGERRAGTTRAARATASQTKRSPRFAVERDDRAVWEAVRQGLSGGVLRD